MATSIILAQILGLYLVLMSLSMLVHKNYYQQEIPVMLQNSGFAFLTALITLILGIILITFHNVWVFNWTVIITLLAWLMFIKGLLRIFIPGSTQRWSHVIKNNYFYYITFVILLIIGLFLVYKGFETRYVYVVL